MCKPGVTGREGLTCPSSSNARWGKENSTWTLFLYCFPQNRMAQLCSVCIPVALPPGALLPLKEGLPLPPVSLAGFLRPLLRGMPAWQEDTTAKVLRSLHCLAAGPTSALSFLLKDHADSAPHSHQSWRGPWWCSAEMSLKPDSSEHRGGNGVGGWEGVCVWGKPGRRWCVQPEVVRDLG